MKKRGLLKISKELYESENIDDALFGLKIKVFKVEYDPFFGIYDIYFTSKFIESLEICTETPEYTIEVSSGYRLNKVG